MTCELIPVIHIVDEKQVFKNIETCVACGIKKVFLIWHGFNTKAGTLKMAEAVKQKYPELWVGVNLLGEDTENCLMEDYPFDGLWCDNGLTDEPVEIIKELVNERVFKGTFFGGLEFKYLRQSNDIDKACNKSLRLHDVSTTSGSATGVAPTIDKINNLRALLGPTQPLAIASGVNAANIKQFKHLVNYVLVATSITDIFTELIDIEKLRELQNALK